MVTPRSAAPASSPDGVPPGRSAPTGAGARRADRRSVLAGLAGALAGGLPCATSGAGAQEGETRLLRIATGSASGTYFRVGGLVADIVSSPPGSRPCERGGSCGVPGLVAIVQSSPGSVANVRAIERGEAESGFAQGDVAHFAHTGTAMFAGGPSIRRPLPAPGATVRRLVRP